MMRPSAGGHILLDGQDISRLPPHRIVERGVALIPRGAVFSAI
jgi:ABC-type branched-subunit amino acid transport system ATPase component